MKRDFFETPVLPILVTALVTYVYGLPIVTAQWQSRAADFVVGISWLIYYVVFLIFIARFVYKKFETRWTRSEALWGFFNITISGANCIAISGMAIWLLDGSVGKDVVFDNVVNEQNRYRIFFAHFLPMSSNFVYQTGFTTLRGVNGNVIAGLWSITSGYLGLLATLFLFLVVARSIRRSA